MQKLLDNVQYIYSRGKFHALSSETNADATIVVRGLDLSRRLDSDDYNFFFSEESPRICNLYIEGLHAGTSPSGFVRRMMCNLLVNIMAQTPEIIDSDGICLHACGHTRGHDYESLLKLYYTMGFRIVAEEKNKKPENCYVWMSAPIRNILKWCSGL